MEYKLLGAPAADPPVPLRYQGWHRPPEVLQQSGNYLMGGSFSQLFRVVFCDTRFSRQVKCVPSAGSFAPGSSCNSDFCHLSVFIPIAEFETNHSVCLLYAPLVVVANGNVCGFHPHLIWISWALAINENVKVSCIPASWSRLFCLQPLVYLSQLSSLSWFSSCEFVVI